MTGKILLVEDDLDLMHLFNDALVAGGYQVDGFTEPSVAFSHFKANPQEYDLVISDVRMPQMSGLELVKKINQVNRDVKVLLMSAFEMEKDNLKELKLNDFLAKPLHIAQLMNTVKKYLDK